MEPKIEPGLELGVSPSAQLQTEFCVIGKSPRRMLKARTPQQDLGFARTQLNDFGRGLLKPPVTAAQPRHELEQEDSFERPHLPPQGVAEQLVHLYYDYIHRHFPILHWPTFHQRYLLAYDREGIATMPREWIATLFAVFACGVLYTRSPYRMREGKAFLTQSTSIINFWEDDVSLDQATISFLASIFLAEVNRKSASWIWLGAAIRIAQDLGLHVQGGNWSSTEGEMRKRIWYSFYCWDR